MPVVDSGATTGAPVVVVTGGAPVVVVTGGELVVVVAGTVVVVVAGGAFLVTVIGVEVVVVRNGGTTSVVVVTETWCRRLRNAPDRRVVIVVDVVPLEVPVEDERVFGVEVEVEVEGCPTARLGLL